MYRSPSLRPLGGLVFALAVGLLAAPAPARAEYYLSTNGGGACKPAYGASPNFTFTELYAQNIGTADQYVVCNFANFGKGYDMTTVGVYSLVVNFSAGATAGTPVCVARLGFWTNAASVASTVVRSVTIQPGQAGEIRYNPGDLNRAYEFQTLSMNCKVPAGFRLGLIQRWEPDDVVK